MIVIDCEIAKAILGRGEEPRPGIEYCAGWTDYLGMDIACVCTYDLDMHLTRVFLKKQLPDLQAYIAEHGGETAGFNTRRFDLPLLAAHGVTVPPEATHFDALERIWSVVDRNSGGWSLDAIMQATFGQAKSADSGAMAPIHWQTGNRGKTVDGCARDVWLEAKLIRHMMAGKPVKNGRGQIVTVPNSFSTAA